MVKVEDELIRFLLPKAKVRGAIIRGEHITKQAIHIHGLQDEPATLFGQVLLASIMLLSISKGGVRQVLQLDATDAQAPVQRMQAECRSGAVRGYVQWQSGVAAHVEGHGIAAWMGKNMLLSTVRDLGVGQPYVSTIQHDSDWLAEHLIHYLAQSVQVEADMVLHDDMALMLEAMPGCDDHAWFEAVESLAKISNARLAQDTPDQILQHFEHLGCQVVGRDMYAYQCLCTDANMAQVLEGMPSEALQDLADEKGNITLSCQYCKRASQVNIDEEK